MTAETIYRGARDNGSCLYTLDSDCVTDLKYLATSTSDGLVSDPVTLQPYTNLTGTALTTVCNDLTKTVQNALPDTCKKYFNQTAGTIGGRMDIQRVCSPRKLTKGPQP